MGSTDMQDLRLRCVQTCRSMGHSNQMASTPGVLIGVVHSLTRLSDKEIVRVLEAETFRREVSKSVANILLNIVQVGSISLSKRQKQEFKALEHLVVTFLNLETLKSRRLLFIQNPQLVRSVASACPRSAK